MKRRKYSRNPLHVRIPEALDESLKSMLADKELKKYSKSDLIRKALNEFCKDYNQGRFKKIKNCDL